MSSQHMFTKLQVKDFSKGRRTLYVHFVTSNDCVNKKINNREIQAHSALKIILLFKLKTIVSLQNEGYTSKWQRSPLERQLVPFQRRAPEHMKFVMRHS